MSTFAVEPGPLAHAFHLACAQLDTVGAADALWGERLDIWPDDPETRGRIANRLGWLRALDVVEPELPRLRAFAASIQAQGCRRVVLIGMGGSSLAPEVLHRVVGVAPGFPRFAMLDTVHPDAVRAVFAEQSPTLYVVASKSGTTIESTALAAEARRVTARAGGWSPHAVAITDRDTVLHREAIRDRYSEIFVNPSDIGGRYSALSLFGMVPAALMGADLDGLSGAARAMERDCRSQAAAGNPGLALGAFMAAAAANGRDKLTLLLPPAFASFGWWVEQLVAESTGKQGVGIVPVAGEPETAVFGADRCVVDVTFEGQGPDPRARKQARDAAAPRYSIQVPRALDVAAEFMRWEVATAIAGLLLGVNPFDEPNVQQAKNATKALLEVYGIEGRLPFPEPDRIVGGAQLTFSRALSGDGAHRRRSLLDAVRPGDYFAILAYAPPDAAPWAEALEGARTRLAAAGAATTANYGPRYLHSTGQLHKGGPNTGVFVVIATLPDDDLPIPGQPFSFGVLEAAQAIGDFQSLDGAGRRAVFVRMPAREARSLVDVIDALIDPP